MKGNQANDGPTSGLHVTAVSHRLPKPAPFIKLQRSRLTWAQTRDTVRRQLRSLYEAIVKERPNEAAAMERLNAVLHTFDDRLVNVLDLALNAEGPVRAAHQMRAKQLVDMYIDELEQNELITLIDENPWTALNLRKTLSNSLKDLTANLEWEVSNA